MEDSYLEVIMNRRLGTIVLLAVVCTGQMWGQATPSSERTVEESYLQDPLEVMIIQQQAFAVYSPGHG